MKIILFGIFMIGACFAEPQLQLINVVFRHGDRTPAIGALFPNDPHYNSDFYPYGLGALTNNGKERIYRLGELLRKRYEEFLGDVYLPNLLSARSTDIDRTKMSLQIMLAALFPPTDIQKWHKHLNWQPIPYTSLPKELDDLLAVTSQLGFLEEKMRVRKTETFQSIIKHYSPFITKLEKLSGRKITDTYHLTQIYDTLYCEWKMNLNLPNWSKEMFPDGKLYDAALIDYDLMTYDKNMTYQLGGKLAEKIKKDILLATTNGTGSEKLFLYSGHEVNVVGALQSLQIYHKTHIPSYASAVIIELLKDNDKYFVKVLYYHGDTSEFEEMRLPGCLVLCPLKKYLTVVNELLN